LRNRYLLLLILGCLVAAGAFLPLVLNVAHERTKGIEGTPPRNERRSRREALEPLRETIGSPAALRNPPWILFGAYDSGLPNDMSGFVELENRLRFRFPIVSFYNSWGDKVDQQFPFRALDTIDRIGSIPMITWEPFVAEFGAPVRNLPPREEREYATLAAIARGDYDFYVTPWAEAAAEFRKPLFLRFAHAMNDPYRYPWGPQSGNRPYDFVAAWRRVHDIFEKNGATNVIWVWSPNVSMPWIEEYYPGDEYVDWIGIGVLNYGSVARWSRWWSLRQILEKPYATLSKIRKPMMICELGTLTAGGDILEWYEDAFRDIDRRYHRIRGIVLFNERRDRNWSVMQDPETTEFVARQLVRLAPM
jgi:glycosyl hydrolase family 26